MTLYAWEQDGVKRRAIEQQLWDTFGQQASVLVLDMVGFTRSTVERGIVHYLALINRMRQRSPAIIEARGGRVVKFEADNCFAVFKEPALALQAATALLEALGAERTSSMGKEDVIGASCGIDYGDLLLIGEHDFFGAPVNRASKLGEDLARPGQILITEEALSRVPEQQRPAGVSMSVDVGGTSIPVVCLG